VDTGMSWIRANLAFGMFCTSSLLVLLGAVTGLDVDGCNQLNKEKAMYAYPHYDPPLSEQAAYDIVAEVQWMNLDGLRAFGGSGIFASFPLHWYGDNVPSGYFGPQATGHGDPSKEQVLFSLWDGGRGTDAWQPAIPRSCGCERNCNDCGDLDSTGTQCKVFIPAYSGQRLRLRLRQTATDVVETFAGAHWLGDEWEVTIVDIGTSEEWLVGRQLLTNTQRNGVKDIQTFNEHIGCTPCGSFDALEQRSGPWVLKPDGTRLVKMSSKYSCEDCTCKDHIVTAVNGTSPSWSFVSGHNAGNHLDWNSDLFFCDDGIHDCETGPVLEVVV